MANSKRETKKQQFKLSTQGNAHKSERAWGLHAIQNKRPIKKHEEA